MDSDANKNWIAFCRKIQNQRDKEEAERKKWLFLEEEYFVSRGGSLLVKYSNYDKFIEVCGFEFYIVSVENGIKPFLYGKKIKMVPDYIMPTLNWEN